LSQGKDDRSEDLEPAIKPEDNFGILYEESERQVENSLSFFKAKPNVQLALEKKDSSAILETPKPKSFVDSLSSFCQQPKGSLPKDKPSLKTKDPGDSSFLSIKREEKNIFCNSPGTNKTAASLIECCLIKQKENQKLPIGNKIPQRISNCVSGYVNSSPLKIENSRDIEIKQEHDKNSPLLSLLQSQRKKRVKTSDMIAS
jgi:hypothetical protein